ncbi:MAG: D-galactonate transporter [Oscillatoriales cyanobacterium]|nr:MAG: D-galactonate transporter [Oscillatoriales cyanobacterium]TAF99356.1 MAG: D-galactonate transporter [Oscillatoriales cyanobacterium]TAG21013.1 MAG: D-galactonate transporter [Oscillatoriales cyanobacterium]TAG34240.1 MAG: D-galactonate transporter [Oscillatoriales cyanobacterium]TAG55091.1 MAG: D-galactonate transporter [Oscillatoriales cyanobacterium]
MVICYLLLVIGYWLLVSGYWLLVIGYWLLVIDVNLMSNVLLVFCLPLRPDPP